MNISIIDLHKFIIQEIDNPLKLYPFKQFGHFNEFGYDFVSKVIFKNIKN